MVTWVVGINGAIALILGLLAWRLWKLRSSLAQVNQVLVDMEQDSQGALAGMQASLVSGEHSVQQLGGRYRHVNQQLKQVKQVLLLLGWIQGYALRRGSVERSQAVRRRGIERRGPGRKVR